jgi:hypothetical protein
LGFQKRFFWISKRQIQLSKSMNFVIEKREKEMRLGGSMIYVCDRET